MGISRPSSSLSRFPRSHGEGDEGDEARDRPCQGRGAEGDEGDEARERHCQEGRGTEGVEGDEAREHPCQEGRGAEGDEGDVSLRMSTLVCPPRTPGGCASSDVWVSPHSRGAWARTG